MTTRFNGNTGQPLRAALYERVSSEEQVEGYSLDAQDRATRLYCDVHDWTIAKIYRDEGKSARTDDLAKRPQFAAMLADAEAGLLDVIVVHKLDRFARNLRVTLETLERLDKAGVGFVSITENMDFTSPIGKVILATLAAFAQYYSDNLSWETKKGKAERKRQGLWNGLLPFGVKKNGTGNDDDAKRPPVPDPETYPGLLHAFRLAAEGKSDRDVADALNADGYRTTGNRGRNLWTKDSVRRMLCNRFYLGELPDGEGGWMPGQHAPLLDSELFEQARRARAANSTNAAKVNRRHRRYSLSGLAVCGRCDGHLHFHTERSGRPRIYCYQGRQTTNRCRQRSSFLDGIDDQVTAYLRTFRLPEETVSQIVSLFEQADAQRDDSEQRRRQITNRLERIRELYSWSDMTRDDYQAERDRLEAELSSLQATTDRAALIAQAADFLRNLPAAWETSPPELRNGMARLLFQSVEVTDDRLTAVVPQADFAPFFNLADSEKPALLTPVCQASSLAGGSDGIRNAVLEMATPRRVEVPDFRPRRRRTSTGTGGRYAVRPSKLAPAVEDEIASLAGTKSLRALAAQFGVSHETIRAVVRSRTDVLKSLA